MISLWHLTSGPHYRSNSYPSCSLLSEDKPVMMTYEKGDLFGNPLRSDQFALSLHYSRIMESWEPGTCSVWERACSHSYSSLTNHKARHWSCARSVLPIWRWEENKRTQHCYCNNTRCALRFMKGFWPLSGVTNDGSHAHPICRCLVAVSGPALYIREECPITADTWHWSPPRATSQETRFLHSSYSLPNWFICSVSVSILGCT